MNEQRTEDKEAGNVDRWGAFASTTCAVHCAVCAIVPAALAAIGLDFLIGHTAEWVFAAFAIAFALAALILGLRSHGNRLIIAAFTVGIVGLLSARILEGQAHHDHHDGDEAHASAQEKHDEKQEKHDGHHDEKESDHHGDNHDEHGDGHMNIELLGILSGAFLVVGHIGNLRIIRRRRNGVY